MLCVITSGPENLYRGNCMADDVPGHVASSVAVRTRGIDGAKLTVALPMYGLFHRRRPVRDPSEDPLELEPSQDRGDPGGEQPAL